MAFERFSSGMETMESMRYFLAERGVVSKPSPVGEGGAPLAPDQMRAMFNNPIYYGDFRFAGLQHTGKHEPIISKTLFDEVQRVLAIRHPIMRDTAPTGPFNRLVRCAQCNMSVTSQIQRGKRYYHCSRRSRSLVCSPLYLRDTLFESMLSDLIRAYHLPKDLAAQLEEKFALELETALAHLQRAADERTAEILAISQRLALLGETYVDGEMDRATYVKLHNQLKSRRSTLTAEQASPADGIRERFERVRKWISTAQQTAQIADTGSSAEKRQLAVEIFGSNITLNGKSLAGRALKPWDALLASHSTTSMVGVHGFEPWTPEV